MQFCAAKIKPDLKKRMNCSDVTLIDTLGSDLTIVNSARIGFSKQKTKFNTTVDSGLLNYLAKHKHYSPFRHVMLQFHIRCPEFVARQLYKHVVGIETTSTYPTKDHAWNEVSGHYIELNEIYKPTEWRKQSKSNKRGSEGILDPESQKKATAIYNTAIQSIQESYKKLLEMGVAKEQARSLLPLSFMTELYWTISFQAAMNFIKLRTAPDAQLEIRDLAAQIEIITANEFPYAFEAFSAAL